ncbi:hypothetical protein MWU58_01110 [Flavobacteriaceae bacterium S0825]|uniref:acyltransferase n=1 Tax=Gaetbulibacter sp. S0825 TaxID=2720084 RepID=UPI00143036BA|nr:acyltransferase [Gaetbulibacter sp. S0825]MCK0107880.1 hypothetical protein [Flavobacteriaceae bacterium S0825]NIX63516.1 acyltransferase [Gaetbulibacter sp. S0825]
MTLREYVEKRNGVPIGHSSSLKNNLYRSLGAKSFTIFWNFWNPIFGYYLGKRVFKPLKIYFPASLALVLTFIFCGFLHDVVTTIIRGSISIFFSVWFLFMAIAVMTTQYLNHDFKEKTWSVRALINVSIIGFCLSLTILFNTLLFK